MFSLLLGLVVPLSVGNCIDNRPELRYGKKRVKEKIVFGKTSFEAEKSFLGFS